MEIEGDGQGGLKRFIHYPRMHPGAGRQASRKCCERTVTTCTLLPEEMGLEIFR